MRPIVHIGVHKTATSWFQDRVYPHVESHAFLPGERVRHVFLGGDAFDFDADAAREALRRDHGDRPPLICEEDLSGVLHNGPASGYVAREVARRLHATLPDATVVIFVRSQVTAALSWYQQYVREGGTETAHRYLFADQYRHLGHARPFKVPRFSFCQIDYRGLIERYDALFGRERVVVMPFERLQRDRAGLLGELGARLGVALPDPGGARANDSYRAGLLPLVRAANLLTARSVVDKRTVVHLPFWYTARKAAFKRLNRLDLFGPPPCAASLLGQGAIDWIGQRYWQSNRWLAERTGVPLGELGYPVTPPAVAVPPPARALPLRWARH